VKSNNNKSSLRIELRHKRRSLASQQQRQAALGLLAQLRSVPEFLASGKIAMYLVNDGEIDPIAVMKWCWENNKSTYVPIIVQQESNALVFAQVNRGTEFIENKYGIREPVVERDQVISAEHLDLVLVPLVAFDSDGNRIGMGGGYYDTTFEFIHDRAKNTPRKPASDDRPALIGIAHEIQKVDRVCVEHWDIPMTKVVTDKYVYNLGPGSEL
jgi:5-formyltetrahydrofolate cyclo-ligase